MRAGRVGSLRSLLYEGRGCGCGAMSWSYSTMSRRSVSDVASVCRFLSNREMRRIGKCRAKGRGQDGHGGKTSGSRWVNIGYPPAKEKLPTVGLPGSNCLRPWQLYFAEKKVEFPEFGKHPGSTGIDLVVRGGIGIRIRAGRAPPAGRIADAGNGCRRSGSQEMNLRGQAAAGTSERLRSPGARQLSEA